MAQSKVQYGPKDVARAMSSKGRKLDAKRVRAWVREHIARFDDDGYTSHEYTPAEYRSIIAGMTGQAKTGRTSAAVKGRAGATSKAKTPRTARVMGSGPVERNGAAPAAPAAPESVK